jgi:hypothetical protein
LNPSLHNVIGLETGGADAVSGKLFVALLRVSGNADGADASPLSSRISMPTPLGENLIT